ncbi:MAG TPA: hypothetical protein VEX37_03680, partial [Thermomicrobiales bacterium]|nr:hypothetical protein [Thermomicrobiales bacterium]
MIVGLAAIAGTWFIVLAPVVAGLFLLAPPIGIYKHNETPPPRTGVRLEAVPLEDDIAHTLRFRLMLVNVGDVVANDFRIRLLVPQTLVPASSAGRLLGSLLAGAHGRNWFVDSTHDAIAITFRAGASDQISCPAGERLELADLHLPGQSRPLDVTLEYQ